MIYNILSLEERSALREAPEGLSVTAPGSPDYNPVPLPLEKKERLLQMDINAIVQAISTVGFPIAACCIMFWYLQKEQEAHKVEMNTVTEALNKNTLALTELKDLLSLMTGYGGKNDASRESK